MAKAQHVKELSKMILNEPKDFNMDSFIHNDLGTYFESFLTYLKVHHRPYQGKILKKTKCMRPEKIIKAITKIVPHFNPSILENVSLEVIAGCFVYLLHAETPEDIRTPCVQLYLNILTAIKPEWHNRMESANTLIIPFNRYARNSEEVNDFKKYCSRPDQEIVVFDRSKGTQKDCENNLIKTFQWVNENWAYGPSNICDFLFKYILSVIYHSIAVKAGYKDTPYGFEDPVLENFHQQTLIFLQNSVDMDLDLQPLFENNTYMTMSLNILAVTEQYNTVENASRTFQIYNKIISTDQLVNHMVSINKDLFFTIPYTAANISKKYLEKSCPEGERKEVLDKILKLFISIYNMVCKVMKGEEIYTYFHKYFDKFTSIPRVASYLYSAFAQRLINKRQSDSRPWIFLMELARKHDIYAAISCKYAQMMGCFQIPNLLEFEIEDSITDASSFYTHRFKDPSPEVYDFFLKHAEDIIDHPNTLVIQHLKSMWAPLDSYDEVFENFPLPLPPISSISDEDFVILATNFITPFETYAKENDTKTKHRLFGPIASFYDTIQLCSKIPPNIQYEATNVFPYCRLRLFTALLHEKDPLILRRSLEILIAIISHPDVADKLDADSLTAWYLAIMLLMSRKEKELNEIATRAYERSIRFSVTGSSSLLQFFMALLEMKTLPIDDSVIDILSSVPLYAVDQQIPASLVTDFKSRVNANQDLYIQNVTSAIIKPGKQLQQRLIRVVTDLFDQAKENADLWDLYLCLITPILSDEITQPKPNALTLGMLLSALANALKAENATAIDVIRAQLMVIPRMSECAHLQLQQFIASLVEFATDDKFVENNTIWACGYLEIMSVLFIYNYELMRLDASYPKFIKLLSSLAAGNKKEIAKFAGSLMKTVSLFFGGFPFNHSILFPTSPSEVIDVENTIATRSGGILQFSKADDNDDIRVFAQTAVGRFEWDFKPISSEFYAKNKEGDSVTMPQTKSTPTQNFAMQMNLEKSVADLISGFEADRGEIPLFDIQQKFTDEYKEYAQKFNAAKYDEKYEVIRPPTENQNKKASIVHGLGFLRASHLHDVKEIPAEQMQIFLHNLQKANHRFHEKFAVIFVQPNANDVFTIVGTQIEETTPQFQNFVSQLGWNLSIEGYTGPDQLQMDDDRTGKTVFFYADFAREATFYVIPMFAIDLSNQGQTFRKMYLGESNVVIVWVTPGAKFDPISVTTKNNLVYIVIYERTDTPLFTVELITRMNFMVNERHNISFIVRKEQLPDVIRAHAFKAQDEYERTLSHWRHPISNITETLADAVSSLHLKSLKEYNCIAGLMSLAGSGGSKLSRASSFNFGNP